jgi:hypothetical protein
MKYTSRSIGRTAGRRIAKMLGGGTKAQSRVGYVTGLASKYGSAVASHAIKTGLGFVGAAALTGGLELARSAGYEVGGMVRNIVNVDPHLRNNKAVHGYIRAAKGYKSRYPNKAARTNRYGRATFARAMQAHRPLYDQALEFQDRAVRAAIAEAGIPVAAPRRRGRGSPVVAAAAPVPAVGLRRSNRRR